jgi:UDP-GlcNAc3NAcA epimerase
VREETEWTELVKRGFATLTGSDKVKMLEAFQKYNNLTLDYAINLYGNQVGKSIYESLKNSLFV